MPGVFVQPKWGEDSRLSIRGSGLSRNFHLRGVQLYMDGIPINTADGYGDFQEIDPTAYRYVEVYKGANALRYGAASLGGAINFVTPSGRDAPLAAFSLDLGSFGFARTQAQAAGVKGPWDGFITASAQRADGFRDHSDGHAFRGSGNIGYQITPDIETRFYFNGNNVRQRIPGSVTKFSALNTPQTAAANNVAERPAAQHRHAALRQQDDGTLRQHHRRGRRIRGRPAPDASDLPVAGLSVRRLRRVRTGDRRPPHRRLAQPLRRRRQRPQRADRQPAVRQQSAASRARCCRRRSTAAKNTSAYVEDSLFVLPNVAVIGGTQFIHATRNRQDRFLSNGNQSGATEFNLWSPRAGLLWDIDPTWQAFANVSRSAEIPSFGESSSFPAPVIPFTSIRPQRATTYEIGTRGRRPDLYLGARRLSRRHHRRVPVPDQPEHVRHLQRRQRRPNVPSGHRSRARRRRAESNLFVQGERRTGSGCNVAYTFNDFRFRNDPVFGNNFMPGAPPHYLRAELLYQHPSGFSSGRMSSGCPDSYFVDSANTLYEPSPTRCWGLKVGYDDGKWFSAYIEGRNPGPT